MQRVSTIAHGRSACARKRVGQDLHAPTRVIVRVAEKGEATAPSLPDFTGAFVVSGPMGLRRARAFSLVRRSRRTVCGMTACGADPSSHLEGFNRSRAALARYNKARFSDIGGVAHPIKKE